MEGGGIGTTLVTPAGLPDFITADEVADAWGLNMLLYGSPGAGKTVLSSTAQDSEYGKDVLFIDVDGGTRSISDRKDITVFQPTTFGQVDEIGRWAKTADHPFRTFVIDTLTELQALGLKEVMETSRTPDMPGLQDYGKNNKQVADLIRRYKTFAQEKGWNVIFVCHQFDDKNESTGAVLTRPQLTPGLWGQLAGIVDTIGWLTKDQEGNRLLKFENTSWYAAKVRQPPAGPQLPSTIENPSLVDILSTLRGGSK